jgi:hypothetical protein
VLATKDCARRSRSRSKSGLYRDAGSAESFFEGFIPPLSLRLLFSFLFGPLLDRKFSPVGVWLRILTARGLILRALETVRASLAFMVGVDRIEDGKGIDP